MHDILGESLKNLKWIKLHKQRQLAIVLVLSAIVSLNVFWGLRQPGLTLAGDADCGITEHTHTDECFNQVLVCELSEEAHIHEEACYTTQLIEAQENLRLVCTQAEIPHIHGDSCYTTQLTESPETSRLICAETTEPHIHEDSCYEVHYTEAQEIHQLICTQTDETHIHEDSCYEIQITEAQEVRQLSCTQAEQPHVHSDNCYETIAAEPIEETVLNCELQFEPHVHTESCYVLETTEAHEELVLTCDLPETAHIHEDTCYTQELTCEQPEHTHSIECYCDETADVETLLDWQNMFAGYPYTGDLRQDLVGIAKTQAGYTESTKNFEVDSDGIRHGYTRYGAWYGTPYREWSAAFVSFCLSYAGADPAQTPGNIGASTMATLWNNLDRFKPAGEYVPAAGDLVFFADNTVGIVTEVQTATIYVIRGDVEDSVRTDGMPMGDATITGWGITGEISSETPEEPVGEPIEEPVQETVQSSSPEISTEELLDISNGPAFFIFTDSKPKSVQQQFSLKAPRTATDLITYLNGIGGTYQFSLLNTNNQEPPKDPNNDKNYILTADTLYKLTLRLNSANGFSPGTYQYQLPTGIQVNGGTGQFVLNDGTYVGDWTVTDNGLITVVFNENINNRTQVTINATMGVWFTTQNAPIDFDGKITVTVNPPPQMETTTKVTKWGQQGAEDNPEGKTDPTKIYWTILLKGNKNSQIPGSVITDQIKTGTNRYTQEDMENGISFGISDPNNPDPNKQWHSWTVYPGDPNLTWTETGWSYTFPEKIKCWCGEVILQSDGWDYYVNYTSTPEPSNYAGSAAYSNEVTVDGQYAVGWGEFTHSGTSAGIVKTGNFHGDADGGAFHWEFQATIPGRKPGARAAYYTQLVDQMQVKDASGTSVKVNNDVYSATVTAVYNGQTITVPYIRDANTENEFAWDVGWFEDKDGGVKHTVALLMLHRCDCTADSCHYWDAAHGRCNALHYIWENGIANSSGFCLCWTPEDDITFTVSYQTDDPELIAAYGGQNKHLNNQVSLQQQIYKPDGTESNETFGKADADVPIPGIFTKKLTQDFDGYTAHYSITVNEAKLALTNGESLTIRDEMTETLAYISGSLVITTEDQAGNTGTLQPGTDYTVTYDGTGTETDDLGNSVHVMEIVILHPQPVKYVLDYDATLIIPQGTTDDVKYSNSATITLWGEELSSDSEEKVYAEFNIAAMHHRIQLHKKDALNGAALAGATFGLFNEYGGLITSGVTDETGNRLFETNVTQGIILQNHVLYYLQELQAPPGYRLDDRKHWFCFCSSAEDTCEECSDILKELNGYRIPHDTLEIIEAENEIMNYDLPATGGPGIYPLILVSVIFVMTPLVYGSVQRRKRERRGTG